MKSLFTSGADFLYRLCAIALWPVEWGEKFRQVGVADRKIISHDKLHY